MGQSEVDRADLIEAVIVAGKSSQGERFPEATYRALLADATAEQLAEIRFSFENVLEGEM